MKRKKQDAPFELRDPIVPEVRGTLGASSDIVGPGGTPQTNSSEL